ncbi:LacI family DNA-binding transcriptional regulator [Pelagibacterium xiamenense]|uniref:LacI family DNA-binding transcriptional regulator n=1 Tax=Pelagibacterium xiamenense TaxID=2901140 RepID=UPI001E4513E6|nr:LacI family transcriptional regulator [Pelagibacterium xiamenense]
MTIRTVAADAGVSVSAVSKVLRNAYGVSDSLKARVTASIEKLGYRPNASARGMRGRSYTLGVLLSDIRNPFFSEIMAGINTALTDTPYQPLLGVSNSAIGVEQALIDAMIDRQMDGLVFIAPRMDPVAIDAVARKIPSVVIGLHRPTEELFDTVNNDDVTGAEQVVDYLVSQGHSAIAHMSLDLPPDERQAVPFQREKGYLQAMNRHGLARHIRVVYAEHSPKARQKARELLSAPDRPDAVFCWTDACAFESISAAIELGLRVPDDVAIVGYDNSPPCDLAQNSLTSVDQSGRQLGAETARMLMERIEGRTRAEHFVVEPRLVVRGSTRNA